MPSKATVSAIRFYSITGKLPLTSRLKLKLFLLELFKKEKTALSSLHYIFCTDDYLLKINQEFLQHDFFTDIITFNLAGKKAPVEGEVYISIDRVRENAKTLAIPFPQELHRVIFHGALHLCGYKDKKKVDIVEMRKSENSCLSAYFNVPRGTR